MLHKFMPKSLTINFNIYNNDVTLTEKKKGLLSLFILERLFRLLLYVYIFSLFYYFIIIIFFLKNGPYFKNSLSHRFGNQQYYSYNS